MIFAVGIPVNNAGMLTLTFFPAATIMDLRPTVIQLLDQLEFPVLPRNPSVSDPLNVWYIKVFQHNPLELSQLSFMIHVFLSAFPVVFTRASRRPCYDYEELW